jgi:hypothetical protein
MYQAAVIESSHFHILARHPSIISQIQSIISHFTLHSFTVSFHFTSLWYMVNGPFVLTRPSPISLYADTHTHMYNVLR